MSDKTEISHANARFAGSIPIHYHTHLGPTLFEPYAADLTARLAAASPRDVRVLELAAGTGILTRRLRQALPAASIVATDLNDAMIEIAQSFGGDAGVEWRTADATALPFDAGTFDAVVCQFGWMFFPDKARAAHEVRRVLRPGGRFLFNVWGAFDHNPFGRIGHTTIASFFERDPPTFYTVPFGFWNTDAIRETLEGAGFGGVAIETVDVTGIAESADFLARGMVRGQPSIVPLIEERATAPVESVIAAAAAAIAAECGDRPVRLPMRAFVVSATPA